MLLQQFMRISDFSQIPLAELRALASRSHVLCVPDRRWLLRAGRHIDAYFYLLKGSVETIQPARQWRARKFGRLEHFYPGCNAARTVGAAQVLRVDAHQREFLLNSNGESAPTARHAEVWLQQFLNSHMMRRIPVREWQQLLSAFQSQTYAAGSRVLCSGTPGAYCYVVESGHGVVHRGSQTLAHLAPGDFFGEDALVLDTRRNADVSALENMRVHAIPREVFAEVMLENLVQFVSHIAQGVVLRLHGDKASGGVALDGVRDQAKQLNPRQVYYVSGGSRRERALCSLLLVQQGLQAYPVEDPI